MPGATSSTKPHLSHDAKLLMLLHWRPLKPHTPGTSILDYSNPCIKYISERFPGINNYSIHDLYCKQQLMYDASGRRKTNEELYGLDPLLHHHLELAYRFIAEQDGIPILFGRVVLDWFVAEFDAQYVDGCYVFVVNGLERVAYHLDHPEYSIRWASNNRLRATASVLENISTRHGISTRPAQKPSTSKTKRDWVNGDDRMTQIAHRDREQNASRRTQAMLTWWRTATQEQIDATIAKRRATWASTPQAVKDAIVAKKSAAWLAKSDEMRNVINARRSASHLARSKEEVEASNLKRRMTWDATSTQRKDEIVSKRAATIIAKPAHEKEASEAARLAVWDAKPQKVKDEVAAKRQRTIAAKSDVDRKASEKKRQESVAAISESAKVVSMEKRLENLRENKRRKRDGEASLTKKEMKTMSWKNV